MGFTSKPKMVQMGVSDQIWVAQQYLKEL
jgi:hypothetical protein